SRISIRFAREPRSESRLSARNAPARPRPHAGRDSARRARAARRPRGRHRAARGARDASPAGGDRPRRGPGAACREPAPRGGARVLSDETILAIYTALRPRRSTAAELEAWAAQLESRDAPATASFVREAARVYVARGLLAG